MFAQKTAGRFKLNKSTVFIEVAFYNILLGRYTVNVSHRLQSDSFNTEHNIMVS